MRTLQLPKLNAQSVAILVAALALLLTSMASAADTDLARAKERLAAGQAAEAKALFEQALANDPDSIEAHLGLGRAYFELGQYAEAQLVFETVLHLEGLPPDLLTRVTAYNKAAQEYLEEGKRTTFFGYAESGIGGYKTNSTRATSSGDQDSTFFNARVGGGLDHRLDDGYAIDANVDYRFRYHDESGVRNDADLRWRVAGSRSLGENNLAVGFRGRNSYRGNGIFRNDYFLFTSYDMRLDELNQLSIGGQIGRRRYPSGPLEDRTRSTADANIGWTRVLSDRATFSATGHLGRHFNTDRPDGKSTFWGVTVDLDLAIRENLSWYSFAWYESDRYNTDRLHFHPDEIDQVILRRDDNLFEVGTQVIWQFGEGWTFRPEVLYIRDESNAFNFNYSSTEYWLNVRKAF